MRRVWGLQSPSLRSNVVSIRTCIAWSPASASTRRVASMPRRRAIDAVDPVTSALAYEWAARVRAAPSSVARTARSRSSPSNGLARKAVAGSLGEAIVSLPV